MTKTNLSLSKHGHLNRIYKKKRMLILMVYTSLDCHLSNESLREIDSQGIYCCLNFHKIFHEEVYKPNELIS